MNHLIICSSILAYFWWCMPITKAIKWWKHAKTITWNNQIKSYLHRFANWMSCFDIRQNLLCEIKIIKELSQLYNHRITTYITCFKQANYDMFELQPLNKKWPTTTKTSWALFDIQRLEVHMFDKKLGKVGCTYSTKILFPNVWITS
jgi:hypothetical protein